MLGIAACAGVLISTGRLAVVLVLAALMGLAAITITILLQSAMALRRAFGVLLLMVFLSLALVMWEPAPFDLAVPLLAVGVLVLPPARSARAAPFLLLLTLFAASQIGSAALSSDRATSLRWSAISLLMVAVAWLAFQIGCDPRWLRLAVGGYVAGALVTTLVGVLAVAGVMHLPMVLKTGIRLKGFYKDPNVFGSYLVVAILLLIASPITGSPASRWPRRGRALAIVVLSGGVVVTYSRGAWLSLPCALLVYAAIRAPRSPAMLPRVLLAPVLFLPIALLGVAFIRQEPNSYFVSRLGLQSYDQDRFATRDRSLAEFTSRPVLGHGGGTSRDAWGYDPHNVYTRLLYENGVLGLIAFVALALTSVRTAVQAAWTASDDDQRRLAAAFAAALIAICAESIIIDTLHWRHLWLLVGWCWSTASWRRAPVARVEPAPLPRPLRGAMPGLGAAPARLGHSAASASTRGDAG